MTDGTLLTAILAPKENETVCKCISPICVLARKDENDRVFLMKTVFQWIYILSLFCLM